MKTGLLLTCLLYSSPAAHAGDEAAMIARFLDYKRLPCLTSNRVDVVQNTASYCRDPQSIFGPHLESGILIYVSQNVLETRRENPGSKTHPVGALIVKEKFDSATNAAPGIITVMEKMTDTGRVEDWRFFMIRVADRTIIKDGFKRSCVDCPSRWEENDFVSHPTDRLLTQQALNKDFKTALPPVPLKIAE